MDQFVELGGTVDGEERGMQQQSFLAKVGMVLILITMPFFSPFYFLGLLFYQCCLVERLNGMAKVGTLIVGVFLGVAWVPPVCAIIYFKDPTVNKEDCVFNQVNGLAPLGLFSVFCIWALWVALRHFSIADSYEDVRDRAHLRHLKTVELAPPLSPETEDSKGERIINAFDLYFALKGNNPPYVLTACLLTIGLTGAVVLPARGFGTGELGFGLPNCTIPAVVDSGGVVLEPAKSVSTTLFFLSTIQYTGIFFVFYASIVSVMVGFLHETRLLKNLKLCLPDYESETMRMINLQSPMRASKREGGHKIPCRLDPTNITHIRAWDAVRRAAVQELTDSNSVFQSIFDPTLAILVLATIGCYVYIVYRLLFLRRPIGFFTGSLAVFASIAFLTLLGVFLFARHAQSYLKSHRTLIAKLCFDFSRELDKQLVLRLEAEGRYSQHLITGDGRKQQITEELLSSLIAMRTYLVSNLPRIKVLGVELQHLRWAVAILMLINGMVMFFALMIGIRNHMCGS